MEIRYKFARQNRTTYNDFTLPANGEWFYPKNCIDKAIPCSNTVLHHYLSPHLAVLFNPIHGDYINPILFKIEIDSEIGTDGLKGWCRGQRIIEQIDIPVISVEQRVAFAIYCAEMVYTSPIWDAWAKNWLGNLDRTSHTANAAAIASNAASYASNASYASYAVANAAANASNAAANAAYASYAAAKAAANAAVKASYASYAASYASYVSYVSNASYAAKAANAAANAAAKVATSLNFLDIFQKVLTEVKYENS